MNSKTSQFLLVLFSLIFTTAIYSQQNSSIRENTLNIYPSLSEDPADRYNVVVDYNGQEKIFSEDKKNLVLEVDGITMDLPNTNTTSKVKYSLQPSTLGRIPSAVSAKGFYSIKPDELSLIADANSIRVRDVGILRNYNMEVDDNTKDEFSEFLASLIKLPPPPPPETDNGTNDDDAGTETDIQPNLSIEDIGMYFTDLRESLADSYGVESGVVVTKISPSSPASNAGLSAGSVISHINGRKIKGKSFLEEMLKNSEGKKVSFTVKTLQGDTDFIMMDLK